MDYSIYKDSSVEGTVDKIKRILDNVGIEIEEGIYLQSLPGKYKPHSLRVKLFGMESIGTNGKGTSLENARASAYAEFMERLQNQMNIIALDNDDFFCAPDEKNIKIDSIEIFKIVDEFLPRYKLAKIYNNINKFMNDEELICYSYYNIITKKIAYLPILRPNSNGMCAGNTPEEALVQGFSEICERYSMKEIISKGIAMPDIPKEIYEKYEQIKGLIEYIEKYDYEIIIKDASMGLGLPVVCTIFKHKYEDFFVLKFGSQPSLPVAIERTLTEFAQGISIDNIKKRPRILKGPNYSMYIRNIFASNSLELTLIQNNKYFDELFDSNNAKYKFSLSNWIDENRNYTNKELLKFISDRIKPLCEDIYVRDVSFLGFPAYNIFIPNISNTENLSIKDAEKQVTLYKWIDYVKDKSEEHKDINSLIEALDFKINIDNVYCSITSNSLVCNLPHEYLLILCYIVVGNIDNIIKYSRIILDYKLYVEDIKLIEMILKYYECIQEGKNKEQIDDMFYFNFSKNDKERFYKFINELSFEYIKKIISDSNKERLKRIEEENKLHEKENRELNEKIAKVKERLIEAYIKNTPDQSKLKDVFEGIV